ncbi:MAG: DegV family protein [Anaerolineae bacterium]|nr:DegV family protein [Anaerolineae bacterium]
MQIVTDSGTDLRMVSEEAADLGVTTIPLVVTLGGKSYREGIDITPDEFYRLLAETDELPTTSQPSAGDFAEVYRRLAATDPDILSVHMSSGLSGTLNSALAGAKMVPEANVTHVDTKTLSAGAGWQVDAAARAVKKGWPTDKILDLVAKISAATESVYTLEELKYLIHGGRISHMKGLIASILNIKPVIGVEKVKGTYVQMGQARAFKGAIDKIVSLMVNKHPEGSDLHVQVLYSHYPDGAALLRERIGQVFNCTWLASGPISLVLGAHTGPSLVGVAFAPQAAFTGMP